MVEVRLRMSASIGRGGRGARGGGEGGAKRIGDRSRLRARERLFRGGNVLVRTGSVPGATWDDLRAGCEVNVATVGASKPSMLGSGSLRAERGLPGGEDWGGGEKAGTKL